MEYFTSPVCQTDHTARWSCLLASSINLCFIRFLPWLTWQSLDYYQELEWKGSPNFPLTPHTWYWADWEISQWAWEQGKEPEINISYTSPFSPFRCSPSSWCCCPPSCDLIPELLEQQKMSQLSREILGRISAESSYFLGLPRTEPSAGEIIIH